MPTVLLFIVSAVVALSPLRASAVALSPRRAPPVPDAGNSISSTGWQLGKSLAECNRYMLDSQLATDITFQVIIRSAYTRVPDIPGNVYMYNHYYALSTSSALFNTRHL